MLEEKIEDNERLHRAVKPGMWKDGFNRPTSALFKDSKGVSVDRQGDRNVKQIIDRFKSQFKIIAVVSITAKQCRDFNTYVFPKKEPNNPYHAEIHESPTVITLSRKKAKLLSENVHIDFKEEGIED